MSKVLSLVLAILLLFSFSCSALAATDNFYVTDETGVLSQSTINYVESINAELEEKCEAQIVIIFVDYFGNTGSDEYAVKAFNEKQVSSKGMLLAACPNEGRGWLTTGEDVEGRFSDSECEEYLNKYFWDDFDNRNYDEAVITLVDKLCQWYEKEYNTSISVSSGADDSPYSDNGNGSGSASAISLITSVISESVFVIFLLIVIIIFILFLASGRIGFGCLSGGCLGNGCIGSRPRYMYRPPRSGWFNTGTPPRGGPGPFGGGRPGGFTGGGHSGGGSHGGGFGGGSRGGGMGGRSGGGGGGRR